jgi:iron complex outermembrane receptor protein
MKFQKFLITILIVVCSSVISFAQNFKGIVYDELRQPIAGATVIAEKRVLISNNKGEFYLNKNPESKLKINIFMIGYDSINQQINQEASLVFILKKSIKILEDAIVTAQKLKDNAAASFDLLQKEAIAKNNLGQDLPYLLNQLPATVITSDAGTGIGYTGIRIRGTDASRTNVTINGIPLNDAESQGTFLVNLPDLASSIDNIQVQRGVGSSINGAGAFGASINIQTAKITDSAGFELATGSGSFGTKKWMGKFSTGQLKNNWSFAGRASHIRSDGYIQNSAATLNSYFFNANYITKDVIWKFNMFAGSEKTFLAWEGVPIDSMQTNRRYNPIAANYKDQYDLYAQTHYQSFYTKLLNAQASYTIGLHLTNGKGFFQEFKYDQAFASIGFDTLFVGADTINSTNLLRRRWLANQFKGIVFSYQNTINNRLHLQVGAAANVYDGQHFAEVVWAQYASQSLPQQNIFEGTGLKTEANVYCKIDYEFKPKFNAYLDLQTRLIRYRLGGENIYLMNISQNANYLFFNPKLGISYTPNNKEVFYVSYSIANKEPNRDDLISNLSRSKKALAEQLADIELGWKYQNSKIRSAWNVYYMNYKNQLIPTGKLNDVGESIRENCAQSYRLGLEWNGMLAISSKLSIGANAAISANKILNYTDVLYNYDPINYSIIDTIEQEYQKTNLAYSPAIIIGAVINYQFSKSIGFSLQNKYVGQQYLDNTSSKEKMIKAFMVNDIIINYIKPLKNKTILNLDIKLANILNRKYVANGYTYSYLVGGEKTTAVYYYPQATRSILLGLSLKF